jgi:hypothetical protein
MLLISAPGTCFPPGYRGAPYSRRSQVPSAPINRLKNQQYLLTQPIYKKQKQHVGNATCCFLFILLTLSFFEFFFFE